MIAASDSQINLRCNFRWANKSFRKKIEVESILAFLMNQIYIVKFYIASTTLPSLHPELKTVTYYYPKQKKIPLSKHEKTSFHILHTNPSLTINQTTPRSITSVTSNIITKPLTRTPIP